nr:MFS transporter [uncultured Gemmiger sp.]
MNDAKRARNVGFAAFFLSGICAISSGVVVSLLQQRYGLAYGVSGSLISVMSVGNLVAGFLAGLLPGRLGLKVTTLILGTGYALGYALMGLSGQIWLLTAAFALVGLAKGGTINACTILVGDNVPDRTRGMNAMHSCYACGALLCPFVAAAAAAALGADGPTIVLAVLGVGLVLAFAAAPASLTGRRQSAARPDWSFCRSPKFWLLTALIFCQNGAETSVTGWLVTYFKDRGILSESVSPYTVTLLWGATMAARLVLAFVHPPKDPYRAMLWMGLGCTVFYGGLMLARTQVPALLLLLLFALSIAGMNPTAVACAGQMTSVTSMGVMLPVAGLGAILMPWVIGVVADHAGLLAGMACNILPCAGMLLFAALVRRTAAKETA